MKLHYALLVGVIFLLSQSMVKGQEIHHHEGMSVSVDKFYSTWYMPDQPTKSCCNTQDCYPTVARFINKQWWAQRREDGKFIPVPWSKVERNRDNPDGRSHMCAPPPSREDDEYSYYPPDTVFCFSLGGGT